MIFTIAFVTIALLPIMVMRDFTPGNELRYLSIADEALRKGTFFTFTNHGVAYADKPPLYLWIIMAGRLLLGKHYMWFLSLFSIIPAFIIIHIMDSWVKNEMQTEARITSVFMLLSCGVFSVMCVTIRMDMLMCMFITLSLYTFYKMYIGQEKTGISHFLFPLYIFLGVFTKGPLAILIPFISTVIFLLIKRQGRHIHEYWGWRTWGFLFIFFGLWFTCVYIESGSDYLYNLIIRQTFGRAYDSFHHARPFYFYIYSIWYAFFPWSLLIAGLIAIGWHKKLFSSDLKKLFSITIISTFILLSCISSKIVVYTLPLFPFTIYLATSVLQDIRWNKWIAITIGIPNILLTTAAMVLLTGMKHLPYYHGMHYSIIVIFIFSSISIYLLYHDKHICESICALAIGLFCTFFVSGCQIKEYNKYIGYGDFCNTVIHMAHEKHLSAYYTCGIKRSENIDVYIHHGITKYEDVKDLPHSKIQGILIIPKKDIKNLPHYITNSEYNESGKYMIYAIK